MADSQAKQPHSATISAVVIRADGTRHEVGVVAAGYSNPVRQWWWDQVGRRMSERRIRRINSHVTPTKER